MNARPSESSSATGTSADKTDAGAKSDNDGCSTGDDQSSTNDASQSNGSEAKNTAKHTSKIQHGLNCHFAGLEFAAGPVSGGGFGAQLKGDHQYDLTSFNAGPPLGGFLEMPNQLSVGYATNDSWDSKPDSHNQVSVDLKLSLDGAMLTPLHPLPNPIPPECNHDWNLPQCGSGGEPLLGYGLYGDLRYRYGTFDDQGSLSHVNQVLGGGGIYFVWQKGMLNQPWIDIWPGVSLTYYSPISTDTPLLKGILPDGIKADFLQAEFKTGLRFPVAGHPFRLIVKYDGSLPTNGLNNSWESLWNVQLSADLFDSGFEPAITFQSGKNGGLSYDRQLLFGIVKHLSE
ncbi:MAG: hypothetical protein JO056_03105 [Alphaproteobacteria bacterium]|nr:hypothetical protein [Alphaproteobacteria bacterium]